MYCTIDNIKGIMSEQDLIELTDDSIPSQVIVSANVNKAISDAGEMIDGYLRARYSMPLLPVPGLIATLACDIVAYRLYARRAKLTPPEGVSERYRNALKLLGQIQKGEIDLGVGAANTPEVGDSAEATSSERRIFTRKTMRGF
jgi:phage gp36-like protein